MAGGQRRLTWAILTEFWVEPPAWYSTLFLLTISSNLKQTKIKEMLHKTLFKNNYRLTVAMPSAGEKRRFIEVMKEDMQRMQGTWWDGYKCRVDQNFLEFVCQMQLSPFNMPASSIKFLMIMSPNLVVSLKPTEFSHFLFLPIVWFKRWQSCCFDSATLLPPTLFPAAVAIKLYSASEQKYFPSPNVPHTNFAASCWK